ncbi:MBL fold metallo-hydrolase [Dechloromonas sp.]|uniref:MBL fold metallo-hydrolase n=1 Tax=Dechloromonas sp. TaxID=1917218 RepID=UPI00120139E2|nr:MBL fold metallo-hydrolase [Dechloromonas sp.]MBU3697289.1 MBL fold metallo-hydrolase [Dechloromonas sp.]TEX44464.1 MAG: MBL fold metallo-hydrolase [Rhodocyclaceae bacterium]
MFDWRDYGNGIYAFDAGYVRPILAAIHMIVDNGRVAFVDTGSNDSLPNVLEALNKLGLGREAVDYVILTHIHLDHAGGAGTLMREFPNAKLVVHPRGSRHMAEPSKLVAGVTAVYGAEYVENVYGDILPIPADRIIDAHEGLTLPLGRRELLCIDTPGHAKHHICIVDKQSASIFTGDMFGLSYREFDVDGRQFILPTTSPTQFDAAEMHASIDRLMGFAPQAMYLTHYAQLHDVPAQAAALRRRLDAHVAVAEAHVDAGEARHAAIKQGITDVLLGDLRAHGCTLQEATILEVLATDLELNAQGLAWWLDHRG